MHRPATITLRVSPLTSRLRRPGRRSGRALAAVLVGALALSACQTQSPVQTDVPYQPADGVAVNLGAVQARDLVVVTGGKDAGRRPVGSLINTGGDPVTVTFSLPTRPSRARRTAPAMQLTGSQQIADQRHPDPRPSRPLRAT